MKKTFQSLLIYLIPIAVIAYFISFNSERLDEIKNLRIDQFVEYIQDARIQELKAKGSNYSGTLKDGTKFKVFLPDEIRKDFYDNYLKEPVEKKQVELTGEYEPGKPWYLEILPTILLLLGMIVIWFLFMNQTQGGNSKAMSFGKSRAKLNKDENNSVTFADVAGLKEEKEELEEIVDFLKNPKKYIQIGARIPKGVLLVGPPGTGKTYLSRAVAGEAKVPFFSISGSDFVEMFVGVGASRVRDLFEQAKKNSPCIVFIDEIDAVGRKRGAGLGGGHDEREQTLNQLLVEMDGFGKNEGIIVMAATNRPDILDPAILRPGRFDRNIYVGMPDLKEREEILKVHTRKKQLAEDVNLRSVAKTTSGFSPADLENLTNEAALLAARHNQSRIEDKDFREAAIKVVAGPEKKSAVVIERERILTAYHEAGHAIVSTFLKETDKVHMITIVPRGRAGGFTAYQPQEDMKFMTKTSMKNRIVSLLGGRAAEAVVLDDISTGASNDIERATEIARAMVKKYGMSENLGPVNYDNDDGQVFLGNEIGKAHDYSEKIAYEIDVEVRKIIEWAYEMAIHLLKENRSLLEECAKRLLDQETIHEEEFISLVNEYKNNSKKINSIDEVQYTGEENELDTSK